MHTTMMPPPAAPENHPAPALDWMEQTTPETLHHLDITDTDELFSPGLLENETYQQQAARRQAADDIRQDRLSELADRFLREGRS